MKYKIYHEYYIFRNFLTFLEEKPIFGIPLHVAVDRNKIHDGIELPVIVRECIDYIEEHGLYYFSNLILLETY